MNLDQYEASIKRITRANRYYGFVGGLSAALQVLRDLGVSTTDPSREAIFTMMLNVTEDDVASILDKAHERNSK